MKDFRRIGCGKQRRWKEQGRWYIRSMAGIMVFAVFMGSLAGCSSTKAENTAAPQEESRQEGGFGEQNNQENGLQESKNQENGGQKGGKNPENGQENQRGNSEKTDGTGGEIPVVKNGKITLGATEIALDPEDEYTRWDENSAVKIELSDQGIIVQGQGAKADKNTVTITDAGTYYVKGTLSDGTILVNAGDEDTVRLIFDGVEIHSETSAAVDIQQAKKAIISLEEGSVNILSDSKNLIYRNEEKEEPNAALFCKNDLTINGSGTLSVTGSFNNGIGAKDTLKLVGGIIDVHAANHGIKGNDALVVYGGQSTVTAAGDGLKSDTLAAVLGGDIRIDNSEEGVEAETVLVYGGTIDLTASDDGINASTDETNTPWLYFMGGEITLRAEGDGIDSNGSIAMSGGQITVYGPSRRDNGALDYDREFTLTGGRLAAFGPGAMEQNVSTAESQVSVLVDFQESQKAGTTVILRDPAGNELYKGTGEKDFQTVVLSVPEMVTGSEYTIEAGEVAISFTPEENLTYVNKEGIQEAAAMGPGPRGAGGRGGRMNAGEGQPGKGDRPEPPEGRKEGERPEPPEGRKEGERPEPPEGWKEGEGPEPPEDWKEGEGPEPPEDWKEGDRPEGRGGRSGEKWNESDTSGT